MAEEHPKHVQEMLAWPNISITLDTYGNVLPGINDGLASGMEDALRWAIAAALLPPGFAV